MTKPTGSRWNSRWLAVIIQVAFTPPALVHALHFTFPAHSSQARHVTKQQTSVVACTSDKGAGC